MEFIKEEEYRMLIKNLNNDSIERLYTNYKRFMLKKLRQYKVLDEDDREYCCNLAFTKLINSEIVFSLSKDDFEKYLWNYCKSEGWHLQRSRFGDAQTYWRENTPVSLNKKYNKGDKREVELANLLPSDVNVEEEVVTKEILREIERVADRYKSKNYVKCFKMFYFEHKDLDTIAEECGIKRKSAQDFIYNVRKFVREKLANTYC